MNSIKVEEVVPGQFRLYLVAGTTPVDVARSCAGAAQTAGGTSRESGVTI
jgi:hypothetical protein